jgi:hypothetical protein
VSTKHKQAWINYPQWKKNTFKNRKTLRKKKTKKDKTNWECNDDHKMRDFKNKQSTKV